MVTKLLNDHFNFTQILKGNELGCDEIAVIFDVITICISGPIKMLFFDRFLVLHRQTGSRQLLPKLLPTQKFSFTSINLNPEQTVIGKTGVTMALSAFLIVAKSYSHEIV